MLTSERIKALKTEIVLEKNPANNKGSRSTALGIINRGNNKPVDKRFSPFCFVFHSVFTTFAK